MERQRRKAIDAGVRRAKETRLAVVEVRPEDVELDPNAVCDPTVTGWFSEAHRGERTPQLIDLAITDVLPNPFILMLDDEEVAEERERLRTGQFLAVQGHDPRLFVAGLPDGRFVDIDTPYLCEAYRGLRPTVEAVVMGTFTPEDCDRIGLVLNG